MATSGTHLVDELEIAFKVFGLLNNVQLIEIQNKKVNSYVFDIYTIMNTSLSMDL